MPEPSLPTPSPVDPPPSWYRRATTRLWALSATRYALGAMLLVSVIDASVFPIPPFALLIPMVLAKPKRWWWLASIGTVASVGGGAIGYYLGRLIHQGAATFLSIDLNARIDRFGIHETIGQLLGENFWVLSLLCSVLPTPFKVVAIGSGIVSVPFPKFMLAAAIGRVVRYFAVAWGTAFAGPRARKWLLA